MHHLRFLPGVSKIINIEIPVRRLALPRLAPRRGVSKIGLAYLTGRLSRLERGERVDDSNEQPVIGDRQRESADVLAIVALSFAAVAFRHFALIRRNSLSRMAAIDPLLTVMSVSFRLGKVRVTRCACSNMSGDLPERPHGIWNRLSVQPRGHRLTLADRSTQLCRKARIPRQFPNAG